MIYIFICKRAWKVCRFGGQEARTRPESRQDIRFSVALELKTTSETYWVEFSSKVSLRGLVDAQDVDDFEPRTQ